MPIKLRQVVIPSNAPYLPASMSVDLVYALQGLNGGKADEHQQRHALHWIINSVAKYYDMSYRPTDSGGDRDSAFAEGKRFVAEQIVKAINKTPEQIAAMRVAEQAAIDAKNKSQGGSDDEMPET